MYKQFFKSKLLRIIVTVLVLFFGVTGGLIVYFFHSYFSLIPQMPKILGFESSQTYLILFQNNYELRPGGGFIGSYATIQVDHGKFEDFSIHNTYDADGQLHQHVEPYYIERRFVQKNLYMRDSNFDVDFAKSVQKVAYMYQLETGHHANGVIAIDLSYIQNIVSLFSPIYIWQYNQSVTPSNFFLLTESHVENETFSGSTQKQDFLQSLAESMLTQFHQNQLHILIGIIQKSIAAISQKHLLFASEDPTIQKVLSKNNVSSTLEDARPNTSGTVNDFLGINEANIGVNKANYFLKRSIAHTVTIQNSGSIQEKLHISYTNTSQKIAWPTGIYAAYVRIIVPQGTKLQNILFNGHQQKLVPAVTDYHMYEQSGFTPPDGLEVDHMDEEGKTIYGFRIIVPLHTTLSVGVDYVLSNKITTKSPTYNIIYFKQPGTNNDPLTLSLHYPTSYTLKTTNTPPNSGGSYMYLVKTTLLTDKNVIVKLAEQ